MKTLSIVIPVYYNEHTLVDLYTDIMDKIVGTDKFDYEIIMVDDGSEDRSWEIMRSLAENDSRVRIYRLSRNFGSHAAILCGFSKSTGDCVVVKAADLQEPSEMILEMYDRWEKGDNVVLAVRQGREESVRQVMFASLYYWITRKFALSTMPKGGFDICLLDRKVIEVLERMDEKNSALTGQILWSGFKTSHVYYTRISRTVGKSRWTLKKKIRLVSDTLFSFSTLPITAISLIGVASLIGALIWAAAVLINNLAGNIDVAGWTTLFIFNLFSFGVMMMTIGLLGAYLWRAFDSSRNRPPYIIEEEFKREKDAPEN